MPWSGFLAKLPFAMRAFDNRVILGLFDDSHFFWIHFLISILFKNSSKCQRLSLPLGHLLFGSFIFRFRDRLFYHFFMLPINHSVICSIIFFSFILEDFLTIFFMFFNAFWIKFTATDSTSYQLWIRILNNFNLVVFVNIFDTLLFESFWFLCCFWMFLLIFHVFLKWR